MQPGDTLSAIAQRCAASEGAILAVNPYIDGSGDLQVGTTVRIEARDSTRTRVARTISRFAKQTNQALDRLTDQLDTSTRDILDRNPDLKSRLENLGSQLGLADIPSEGSLSVAPQSGASGSTATVTGTNLPKNTSVVVGAGAPGVAYRVLQASGTTATGTIEVSVQVPTEQPASQIVFVVADADGRVLARSGLFTLPR